MISLAFLWLALLVVVGADETTPSRIDLPCDQYLNSSNYRNILGSWHSSIVHMTNAEQYVPSTHKILTITEPTLEDISNNNVSTQSSLSSNPKILLSFKHDNPLGKHLLDMLLEVTNKFRIVPGYYNKDLKSTDIRIRKFGDQLFAMEKYNCNIDIEDCTAARNIQLIKAVDFLVSQEVMQAVLRCYF